MYTFARLQNCTDLNNAEDFYFHVVIVFLSEYETDIFKKKFVKIYQFSPSSFAVRIRIANLG